MPLRLLTSGSSSCRLLTDGRLARLAGERIEFAEQRLLSRLQVAVLGFEQRHRLGHVLRWPRLRVLTPAAVRDSGEPVVGEMPARAEGREVLLDLILSQREVGVLQWPQALGHVPPIVECLLL